MSVLPEVGALLEGSARLQTNTWLRPIKIDGLVCSVLFDHFWPADGTDYFPETLVPVFYVDRHAHVSEAMGDWLRLRLITTRTAFKTIGGLLIVGAVLLTAFAGYRCATASTRGPKHLVAAEGYASIQPVA